MQNLPSFVKVTVFVLDMDGVLTDGKLLLLPDQTQVRSMHIKDGYALQLAIKKGYTILVLSGSTSEPATIRLQKLGLKHILMGVQNKRDTLLAWFKQHKISPEEVLYMGDDLPDWSAMQLCGIATCPVDAVSEIKSIAHYVSGLPGGEGCVRDVIEKVLQARGDWQPTEGIISQ